MAQVEMHVTDLLVPLWMCPTCKREPGPLEAQDEYVWRRGAMTVMDAIEKLVSEHRRSTGHMGAAIVERERQYIELVCA